MRRGQRLVAPAGFLSLHTQQHPKSDLDRYGGVLRGEYLSEVLVVARHFAGPSWVLGACHAAGLGGAILEREGFAGPVARYPPARPVRGGIVGLGFVEPEDDAGARDDRAGN